MTEAVERRRARFLEALDVAGLNQSDFAKVHAISRAHLSIVISGQRDSVRMWQRIDRFADHVLGRDGSAVVVSG